jgi:hypothetical protein
MIIKMREVTSASLAKLLAFLESSENELSPEYTKRLVFSLLSVNPGSEKGMYSVDLDMLDDYNNGEFNSRRRTDPKYLVRVYKILVGR